jgi:hypothetical protein
MKMTPIALHNCEKLHPIVSSDYHTPQKENKTHDLFASLLYGMLQLFAKDDLVPVWRDDAELPEAPRLVGKLMPDRNASRRVLGVQLCCIGNVEICEPRMIATISYWNRIMAMTKPKFARASCKERPSIHAKTLNESELLDIEALRCVQVANRQNERARSDFAHRVPCLPLCDFATRPNARIQRPPKARTPLDWFASQYVVEVNCVGLWSISLPKNAN